MKLEEATKAMETSAERKKAQELKEDLMRLKRVEQVYVSEFFLLPRLVFDVIFEQSAVLPVLSGWVLVLLKLLLATVSAGQNTQVPQSATSGVFPPVVTRTYPEYLTNIG